MKIGIIGSGEVGQQLGLGLVKSGHEVKIGTRSPDKLKDWLQKAGSKASIGSVEEAAKFGEMIVLATKWAEGAADSAIKSAGKKNLAGKIVMDVTNPLVSGEKGVPTLGIAYPQSAGSIIQGWLPDSKVVKAFNIVTAHYMANPKLKQGIPDMFVAGNDSGAKKTVMDIARAWGWDVVDIGDIHQAYLLEALAMLWIRYGFLNNNWKHAFKLLKE